jgi:hypothetical protein
MRWEVEMTADPDVSNDTFEGESLEVLAKWQQTLEPSQRLNATGDVLVRGAPGISTAQVCAGLRCFMSTADACWWAQREGSWHCRQQTPADSQLPCLPDN